MSIRTIALTVSTLTIASGSSAHDSTHAINAIKGMSKKLFDKLSCDTVLARPEAADLKSQVDAEAISALVFASP